MLEFDVGQWPSSDAVIVSANMPSILQVYSLCSMLCILPKLGTECYVEYIDIAYLDGELYM